MNFSWKIIVICLTCWFHLELVAVDKLKEPVNLQDYTLKL